jgi:REP element-mobilizing transposase RayT
VSRPPYRGRPRPRFLDAGAGSCLFRDERAAQIVADALQFFHGSRYRLHTWCVMPNHVHVVVQPAPEYPLEKILHTWKSYTVNQINKKLSRSGKLWQEEYFDRLLRGEDDLREANEYVLDNPRRARLTDWRWVGSCGAERS